MSSQSDQTRGFESRRMERFHAFHPNGHAPIAGGSPNTHVSETQAGQMSATHSPMAQFNAQLQRSSHR
jgi:hypothetical protein